MIETVKIDDVEYKTENMSEIAKSSISQLKFTSKKLHELNAMIALLLCAKKGYIDNLKKEMVASKAGLLIDD